MIKSKFFLLQGIQRGDFHVQVVLDFPVLDLNNENVVIESVDGNGVDGVAVTIFGSATNWSLSVSLPESVEGRLKMAICGRLTRLGGLESEGVESDTITVAYNNIESVRAEFGDVFYRDRSLVVPVLFEDIVVADSPTLFEVDFVDGYDLFEMDYQLYGDGRFYELVFDIPRHRKGVFRIRAIGDVISRGVFVVVIVDTLLVEYDTRFSVLRMIRKLRQKMFQKSLKELSSAVEVIEIEKN